MPFSFQLRAKDLPIPLTDGAGEAALLQLFECRDPDCRSANDLYGSATLVRLVRGPALKQGGKRKQLPEGLTPASPQRVKGFMQLPDWPPLLEAETALQAWAEATAGRSSAGDWLEAYQQEFPVPHLKVGGYPRWIQDPERPACEGCDRVPRVIVQIREEEILGIGPYGDAGRAWVFQCPAHVERLWFSWQSS